MHSQLISTMSFLEDAIDIKYWLNHQSLVINGYPDEILLCSQNSNYSQLNRFYEIHNRYCLILTLAGEFGVVVAGKPHCVKENHGILIFPFQSHCFTFERPDSHLLIITFTLKDATNINILKDNTFLFPHHTELMIEEILNLWKMLSTEVEHIWTISKLLKLFLVACTQSTLSLHEITDPLLQKAQCILSNSKKVSITAQNLAEIMQVPQRQLSALYKQFYGATLTDILQHIRVDYIIQLLSHDTYSIKEIADKAGFESSPSFCRFVRIKFNLTPLELRHYFQNNPIQLQYHPIKKRSLHERSHRTPHIL